MEEQAMESQAMRGRRSVTGDGLQAMGSRAMEAAEGHRSVDAIYLTHLPVHLSFPSRKVTRLQHRDEV